MRRQLSRPRQRIDSMALTGDLEEDMSSTSVYVRRLMKDSQGHPKYPRVPPSLVEYKTARFLLMSRPTNYTLLPLIHTLREHDVTDLVRVCHSEYDVTALRRSGVTTTDLVYADGGTPSLSLVERWLELLRLCLAATADAGGGGGGCSVAVHCEEGLGRAPLLVGVALVELGMKAEEVVGYLRERRRDVLNARQATYLSGYQGKTRLLKAKMRRDSKEQPGTSSRRSSPEHTHVSDHGWPAERK